MSLLCSCQSEQCIINPPAFSNTSTVLLYDLENWQESQYSDEQLKGIPCAEIAERNVLLDLLSTASYTNTKPMWKGSWLVVVENSDGSKKRIILSPHACFFAISGQKGYFKIKADKRDTFDRLMNQLFVNYMRPMRRGLAVRVHRVSGGEKPSSPGVE